MTNKSQTSVQSSPSPRDTDSIDKPAIANPPLPRKLGKVKVRKQSRAGVLNFNVEDTSMLLDLAEEHLPIGHNHWALVADGFTTYAVQKSRPFRDLDSLRNKFEKLSNIKKPTGSADCPPAVRRAKNIAGETQCKAAARVLGGTDEGKENQSEFQGMHDTGGTEASSATVGERDDKKRTAAGGTKTSTLKKARQNAELLEYVGTMTKYLWEMSKAMSGYHGSSTASLTKAVVMQIANAQAQETNVV